MKSVECTDTPAEVRYNSSSGDKVYEFTDNQQTLEVPENLADDLVQSNKFQWAE